MDLPDGLYQTHLEDTTGASVGVVDFDVDVFIPLSLNQLYADAGSKCLCFIHAEWYLVWDHIYGCHFDNHPGASSDG